MTWHWLLFPFGMLAGLVGRKAWLWLDAALDKWLDSAVTIVFAPEEKAGEIEQVLWGRG